MPWTLEMEEVNSPNDSTKRFTVQNQEKWHKIVIPSTALYNREFYKDESVTVSNELSWINWYKPEFEGYRALSALFSTLPWSLLIHFFWDVVRSNEPFEGVAFAGDEFGTGSSAGRAAAVLVKAFKTRNANIGDKSSVPPRGGIIPRNMFKYGSHSVLKENQTLTISTKFYITTVFMNTN